MPEHLMPEFQDVMRIARTNRARRGFPNSKDDRARSNLLFPLFKPKFPVQFDGLKVFTIGSCFARNIEEVLAPHNVRLPTMAFAAPKSEWPGRPNGLLNEYNPGTMCQRIMFALENKPYPAGTIVPQGDDLYVDLLLPSGSPVTSERAMERREEIASVYGHLSTSGLVIITLGLTEVWFDNETELYLNQLPPRVFSTDRKGRFELRRLDAFDCVPMLEKALEAITASGTHILITVSPVPLSATFTSSDCVQANEFSKSVLRVTAERLTKHPMIDYFPSYEIVRSGGLSSYVDDHIHVKGEIVSLVTTFMIDAYSNS
jgi:hypothetical protein